MIEKVHHIIFPVSDMKKAVSFYENILGLKKIKEWPNFAVFDVAGVQFGLVPGEKVGIHLLVDDVDKDYQRLKEKGSNLLQSPRIIHGVKEQPLSLTPMGICSPSNKSRNKTIDKEIKV